MGVPFESLIPYALMVGMFGITGAGLAVTKLITNNGKRPRWNMDGWDRQMTQRDYRLTGVFREQTDAVEAPVGFEVSSRWKFEKSVGGIPVLRGTPEEIRAQVITVDAEEGDVETSITIYLYTPKEVANAGPHPHGGGYMIGDLNADDLLCHVVAEHAPSNITKVNYRLGLGSKFSTRLIDNLSVFKWVHQNAASFSGDPDQFYTIGGSAGGGLALQVGNHLVKDPTKRESIKGVTVIVPVTLHFDYVPDQYKTIYTAYQDNEDTPVINKESMQIFYDHAEVDPKTPDTFVALDITHHRSFPTLYFVACRADPLRDDALVQGSERS
ncbi:hypothetical protein DV736_g4223, partial [Chaetothyriales sp. CBS 134916]